MLLDDQSVEDQLLARPHQHPLLKARLGDQTVDADLLRLPDAVGAVLGLQIHLGVVALRGGAAPVVEGQHVEAGRERRM